ncbi:MAG: hypothetical protein ACOC46_00110 [Pirellulales bacterium]
MCECQNCCQRPEVLTGKPEQCSPEQIRMCHGEVAEHPCTREGHGQLGGEEE